MQKDKLLLYQNYGIKSRFSGSGLIEYPSPIFRKQLHIKMYDNIFLIVLLKNTYQLSTLSAVLLEDPIILQSRNSLCYFAVKSRLYESASKLLLGQKNFRSFG